MSTDSFGISMSFISSLCSVIILPCSCCFKYLLVQEFPLLNGMHHCSSEFLAVDKACLGEPKAEPAPAVQVIRAGLSLTPRDVEVDSAYFVFGERCRPWTPLPGAKVAAAKACKRLVFPSHPPTHISIPFACLEFQA